MSRLPLFPLNTVLFPGGPLTLRVFEPRYVEMVVERLRSEQPFGVVAIRQGQEVGAAAEFHRVGCLARIVDFDQLQDGLLGITCRGEGKFRVLSHQIRADQLVLAEIEPIATETSVALPSEQQYLQRLLRDALEREELKPYRKHLQEQWEDALWLSYRLAELLPMPLLTRQALLELDEPIGRLNILAAALESTPATEH